MSRTSVGRDFVTDSLFKDTSRPNAALVVVLSESSTAVPAQGANNHTAIGGATGNEVTTDALGRAVGVYAHTVGAQTSTLQKTFTHSGPAGGGTAHTIKIVGVFAPTAAGVAGAADTGTMVFEITEPNPPTLTGTDSLNQTVSIDFGS